MADFSRGPCHCRKLWSLQSYIQKSTEQAISNACRMLKLNATSTLSACTRVKPWTHGSSWWRKGS